MTLLNSLDPFTLKTFLFLARDQLRSFYQRELARTLGISAGKMNQILKLLEDEEVVLKEERGKINLYRYNPTNPLGRQLKIFSTLAELNVLTMKLGHASRTLILYGSCAEGEDTSESDVDLLIITADKKPAEEILALTRRAMKRRVSALILTPLEFSQLKSQDRALHRQISRGITLWREE